VGERLLPSLVAEWTYNTRFPDFHQMHKFRGSLVDMVRRCVILAIIGDDKEFLKKPVVSG
jgi:hypothetical protein